MEERKEVAAFAAEMERKLRQHDNSKGAEGWKSCNVSYLLYKLKNEVTELEQEILHGVHPQKVSDEAADVGNLAMMISDVAGTLSHVKKKKKRKGEEDCERRCVVIGGENYYLIVGKNFVDATVPYENRPDNSKLRIIVDTLCNEITKALGGEIPEEENGGTNVD